MLKAISKKIDRVSCNISKSVMRAKYIETSYLENKFQQILIKLNKNYILYYSSTSTYCKIDWLWVRSPLRNKKYLFTIIFSFFRSGVEAKRGVELRHSTRNDSRTCQKVGNEVS